MTGFIVYDTAWRHLPAKTSENTCLLSEFFTLTY
jgi:hypothetical protein